MTQIDQIKENVKGMIQGKKVTQLFTGDKASALLLHITTDMNFHTVFIDTRYHFKEIVDYVTTLSDKIDIICNYEANAYNLIDAKACCYKRKTEVLKIYLSEMKADCLIVPFLQEEKEFGLEDSYLGDINNVMIIKPFYDLTGRDIWKLINQYHISYSSLYNKGFTMIDCECCTSRFGRKQRGAAENQEDFDRETINKLKSLGYM